MSLMGFLGGKDDKKKSSSKKSSTKKPARSSKQSVRSKAPSRGRKSVRQMAMPKTAAPEPVAKAAASDGVTRGGLSVGASPVGARPESTVSGRRKRTSMKSKQLGQLLIKADSITEEQLDQALAVQAEKGGLLGQILISMDICNIGDIGGALRKQRTITTVELSSIVRYEEALGLLDREFCLKNRLFPFEKIGNQLCVAMSNVLDTQAKNDIKESTSMQLKTFDAGWSDIQDAINKYYDKSDAAPKKSIAEQAAEEENASDSSFAIELPDDDDSIVIDDIEEVVEEVEEEIEEIEEVEEVEEAPNLLVVEEVPNEDHALRSVPTEEELEVISPEEIMAQLKAKRAEKKAAEAAKAPEPVAPEVIEIETVDEIELVEVAATIALAATAMPVGVLAAIAVSDAFFDKAVTGQVVKAENRWLAEHTLDEKLPVMAAPYLS